MRQITSLLILYSHSLGDNISTPLYPHQKKALTFLLEREKETIPPSGKQASLWQPQHNGSWLNALTQEVVHGPSPEPKGALLADDMGLGKSLVGSSHVFISPLIFT